MCGWGRVTVVGEVTSPGVAVATSAEFARGSSSQLALPIQDLLDEPQAVSCESVLANPATCCILGRRRSPPCACDVRAPWGVGPARARTCFLPTGFVEERESSPNATSSRGARARHRRHPIRGQPIRRREPAIAAYLSHVDLRLIISVFWFLLACGIFRGARRCCDRAERWGSGGSPACGRGSAIGAAVVRDLGHLRRGLLFRANPVRRTSSPRRLASLPALPARHAASRRAVRDPKREREREGGEMSCREIAGVGPAWAAPWRLRPFVSRRTSSSFPSRSRSARSLLSSLQPWVRGWRHSARARAARGRWNCVVHPFPLLLWQVRTAQ